MRLAQPGEQVVCVDNKLRPGQEIWKRHFLRQLEIGRLYTVTGVATGLLIGEPFYFIKGLQTIGPFPRDGWLADRFILPERKAHVNSQDRSVPVPTRREERVVDMPAQSSDALAGRAERQIGGTIRREARGASSS